MRLKKEVMARLRPASANMRALSVRKIVVEVRAALVRS
jgi:hypothetical protein